MKIKIITDRRPWLDGRKMENGEIANVSDEIADAMIANGFAQRMEVPQPAPKKNKAKVKKDAK